MIIWLDAQLSPKLAPTKGTPVTLTLRRNGTLKQVKVIRDEILVRDVSAVIMMNRSIGYMRIESLMGYKAIDEVNKALTRLKNARGLIIDIRNNPGGLLTNGIELTKLFLDQGTIVSMIDRNGVIKSESADKTAKYKQPLVVLVDTGTASSAEIFAAALRDNNRAAIVGRKTFGRGKVQSTLRLPNGGGMTMTLWRYLSPRKKYIDEDVAPDIVVAPHTCVSDYTRDGQLGKAIGVLATMMQGKQRVPRS